MLQSVPWRNLPNHWRHLFTAGVVATVLGVVSILAALLIEGVTGAALGWAGISATVTGVTVVLWTTLNCA